MCERRDLQRFEQSAENRVLERLERRGFREFKQTTVEKKWWKKVEVCKSWKKRFEEDEERIGLEKVKRRYV